MIKNKKVLVIGASGDIGRAVSSYLAKSGYNLCLHYFRSEKKVMMLARECSSHGVNVEVLCQNLETEISDLTSSFSVLRSVDCIVFANGICNYELFQDILNYDIVRLNRHFLAQVTITKLFLPEMISQQDGNIVFITSVWGDVGASCEVMYSAFMGARNSFVKALSKEVGPSQIRVNAVSPGVINTKMLNSFSKSELDDMVASIPVQRLGNPLDVAYAVSFLLSNNSKYITGEVLHVNGGWYG